MIQTGYRYLLRYLQENDYAVPAPLTLPTTNARQPLDAIAQGFHLSQSEATLVLMVALYHTNAHFQSIFEALGGLQLQQIGDIYTCNTQQPFTLRHDFLRTFLCERNLLTLQPHVLACLQGFTAPPTPPQITDRPANFYALQPLDGHFAFTGDYGIGRKRCFLSLCAHKNRLPFFASQQVHARAQAFQAVVQQGALCVTSPNLLEEVADFLPHLPFFVLIAPTDATYPHLFTVPFAPLTYAQRREIWAQQPDFPPALLDYVSNYVFTPKEIAEIAHDATQYRIMRHEDALTLPNLTEMVHRKLQAKGHNQFHQNKVHYRLADVILPAKQKSTLQEAVAQVKNRAKVHEIYRIADKIQYGTGLSLLLVGPAGTGKTMTALAFAGELNALLYKIDLSMIVSKFVGETEKNLKKIFAEAKNTQAMLFFDEADALFAKRTEVKDSNDKYSNMEAAFLLQEIENYQGTTILATNFLQNIDDSFKRRMRFIVEFPYPTAPERLRIFEESLPVNLPCSADVDLAFLAETFELTGANIKNIVYNAAFLAAENGDVLDMKCLLRSVSTEYEKMGKHVGGAAFGIYAELFEDML